MSRCTIHLGLELWPGRSSSFTLGRTRSPTAPGDRLVQPEGPAGPDGVPRRRLGPAATPAGPSVPRFSSTAYCRDWALSWLTESRPDSGTVCRRLAGPARAAGRPGGEPGEAKLANSCKVANKSLIQAKYFGVALLKITTVTTKQCKSKKGFERLFPIILIRIIGRIIGNS